MKKNIAIISEYNPFHNGHIYQIQEIKKIYPNATITAIMSGNFVQRGEPAILNKYERCKNAIYSGVDLVLQIPTIYSLQSAENFALGPYNILEELNVIDMLSFGVETEDFEKLFEIAKFQYENKEKLEKVIIDYMNRGNSYPKAFELATKKLFNEEVDVFQSNNILALEYIKSKLKNNSSIELLPIKRKGSSYLSEDYKKDLQPSATAIRKMVNQNKFELVNRFVPESTATSLKNVHYNYDYYDIIKYHFLLQKPEFATITGYEKGLDDMLIKNLKSSNNFEEFIENSKSKRFKEGRIKRFILNSLLNIRKDFVDEAISTRPKFVNVLGFNENGKEILKKIVENSHVSLIVNKKDFNLEDELSKKLFQLEERATTLYNIISGETKSEYEYFPIVRK
ncbi:nucleotidyltransferase family protein [Mediannikoviicoccus vaginalis]|uniref:tRNA(Met) cytidine acetate ligase n=1 Tax=Mediannikoviicoccus vaginalis TaxID=2899727 RepID=UPI001F1855A2|nr:nucleotidyltransferase family protein [Mediannikoviicoccus vaginalis]